eukprot:TRINITY_DN5277_c0_g1_i1.p1 TRINITY_DN5277_c0_g1~~TRINITY_DN5277_c0_g1_i1.p1  ORF type:complete len:382 (+),score=84.82 TRINITY_DN5277_c0_g1_i1:394-1539(+)
MGCLTFCSIIAGIFIVILGLLQLGSYVMRIPHSVVVGFTVGIAGVIFLTELGDMVGLDVELGHGGALGKLVGIATRYPDFNYYCVFLSVLTFVLIKGLGKVSVFIPGPIVAIGVSILLAEFVWPNKGIPRVVDKYGPIPTDLLHFTPPWIPQGRYLLLVKTTVSIIFVSVIESLLCSRLADKLANNTRQQFNPNKELWGQGWIQVIVPMLNGFPHTGALARTATNIKVGAVSPLAGIFKCILKLALAVMTTRILNIIPMACVGGILAYVAVNMVKAEEIGEVLRTGKVAPCVVMTLTAATVFLKDFLTGITAGLVVYAIFGIIESFTTPAKESSRYQLMQGGSPSELAGTPYYTGGPDPLAFSKEIPRNVTSASVDAAYSP